jgi:hypothetical protein
MQQSRPVRVEPQPLRRHSARNIAPNAGRFVSAQDAQLAIFPRLRWPEKSEAAHWITSDDRLSFRQVFVITEMYSVALVWSKAGPSLLIANAVRAQT